MLLSLLLYNTSCLLILGNMSLVSLLNESVAGLGNLWQIGIDLIGNKTIYMSTLVSKHLSCFL